MNSSYQRTIRAYRRGFAGSNALSPIREPRKMLGKQIKKVRSHALVATEVAVRGFIFDVDSGRWREAQLRAQRLLLEGPDDWGRETRSGYAVAGCAGFESQ
jgi:hypothetical protein